MSYRPNTDYRLGRDPRARPTQGKGKYPWHLLKKVGDCFLWMDKRMYASLRSAANYRTRTRGEYFTVNRLPGGIRVTRIERPS